jgi:serine/threonine protein kinase
MTIQSANLLVGTLTNLRLLRPPQLEELNRSLAEVSDPRSLAKELIQRGWLTPYQVNQLFQGRGPDLTLTPYIILDRLGEGGAGQVFKARHAALQRVVALKLIRHELLNDAEVVGRFYREVQVLSQLSHPNVVHAYDAGPAGITHFLVMEYLEGNDLAQMVGKSGPLSVDRACDYVSQAAAGLQHAFERGLVHRDIKPSNLFLVPGGVGTEYRWGQVKLLDLGLARLRPAADSATTAPLTEIGASTMGTIDYMAPEQALDFHAVDIRADVYSLGCTLHFLLTGQPPFLGGTMAQKLMRHQQAPPPDVTKLRPDVPPHVAMALQKMIAKRPEDRFQTPAEVTAALASPVATLLPSPVVRPSQGRGLAIAAIVGAAAMMFLVFGMLILFLVPSGRHRESSGPVAVAPLTSQPVEERPPTTSRTVVPPSTEAPRTIAIQGKEQSNDAILEPLPPDVEYRGEAICRREAQNSAWLLRFAIDRAHFSPATHVRKATLTFFVWDPHSSAVTRVGVFPVKVFWSDPTWAQPTRKTTWKGGKSFDPALDLGAAASSTVVRPDPVNDIVDPPVKYDLDVTEIVRSWIEGNVANHGLAVMPIADRTVDNGSQSRFQVRRTTAKQQQYAPKLTIDVGP